MFGLFPDITIVVVLLVIAVVLVLLSRMGLLSKKSLPFVGAALAGVFGWAALKKKREQGLRRDLARKEEELAALTRRADVTRGEVGAAEQERRQAVAALQQQREATQKEILLVRANTQAEVDRINKLHGEDLFREFETTPREP